MQHIIDQLNQFYKEQLELYGSTAQGVNWKDEDAQILRFVQLLKILENESVGFSINDLGCGYGALAPFMQKAGFQDFVFRGYDLSKDMIEKAKETYQNIAQASFYTIQKTQEMVEADYCVASGIFNKKLNLKEFEFLSYILETLEIMNEKSKKGFSFNMLTSYSDKDRQREDLYYANPSFIFDYCMRNFSRNVALLHDYKAYDFTILVKK
ncbi:MAG: class I SAM-dependent methyltransferase [Raineya sp.]|jgi:SAM-dependent methyltransferase|nr:class I SAM-dependent methyltransferase [Raineya sp.]